MASGSNDNTIKLWDTGELIRTFTGHSDSLKCVAFGSNNVLEIGSSDKTIKLWETATGNVLRTLDDHELLCLVSSLWEQQRTCQRVLG